MIADVPRALQVLVSALLVAAVSAAITTRPIKYTILSRTGDASLLTSGGYPMGTLYDQDMKGLKNADGSWLVSHNPDFTSFYEVDGKHYLITQMEAPQPAAIYIASLSRDDVTGDFTTTRVEAVDIKNIGGAYVLCAGSVTPWKTHLGGEEGDPDAKAFEAYVNASQVGKSFLDMMKFYGKSSDASQLTMSEVRDTIKPYNFGRIIEISLGANGAPTATKWFTLGRRQNELAYVMPDKKTVYMTDDGTNKFLSMFVADKEGDLSSGSIYAVQFTQVSSADGGRFTAKPIWLGTSTQEALAKQVQDGLKFSDIFEALPYDKASGKCPKADKTFTLVNAGYGPECLKVKTGMETAAAFHETRRWAAIKGATTEFNKWEGITYDPTSMTLYTAMTSIQSGMEDQRSKGVPDTAYDVGGNNDVKVKYNPCGCVYSIKVDASMMPVDMKSFWCGSTDSNTDADNSCSVMSLSSPDNIAALTLNKKNSALVVSEDTNGHQNNVAWLVNPKTKMATRFFTSPYGAEVTSTYFQEIGEFTYLTLVIQHPYGDEEDKVKEPENTGEGGYIGYINLGKSAQLKKATEITMEEVQVPRGVQRHMWNCSSSMKIYHV